MKLSYRKLKYGLDKVIALVLLLLLSPLFFVLAFLIFKEDRGPVLYISERLGERGLKFKICKFRTMKINAPDLRNSDGSTLTLEADPRVTKIGGLLRKTSLDELPQLINVLKGEMSLVGPRPDLPDAIKLYSPTEMKKLNGKPGITGYNQAYFRNSVSQKEKFKNDVYYIENLSLFFDLRILVVTIKNVLLRKNINNN